MSQFRVQQFRQQSQVDVSEGFFPHIVPATPPITGMLADTSQESLFQASDNDREAETDHLLYSAQGRTTRALEHGRATQVLVENRQGVARTTRALVNPGSGSQALTTALVGTLPSTGAAKKTVVIPGGMKRPQQTDSLKPVRRMSLRLRYGLLVSALMAVITIVLLSLAPLGRDEGQMTALGGAVVKWVQTKQFTWNVGSHKTDPQQVQPVAEQQPGVPAPMPILPRSQYVEIAKQAAASAGIPETYFVNQINAESGFNPNAISPAGAVGIAQFLPSTAALLGIDPYNPTQALYGAAKHMASMVQTYGGNYAKALAGYNAGGGTVDYAVRMGGANWMNFLPYETKGYICKIMGICV